MRCAQGPPGGRSLPPSPLFLSPPPFPPKGAREWQMANDRRRIGFAKFNAKTNGECIRHRRRLGFAISLKRMANEICLYNSLLIGPVCAPLRGEGRGRKERGGGRKGPAPGGPLRAAHPLPSLLLPPWVPGTRPEIPLFVFFSSSSFYFFGSTCHQLRDCCLSTFYFHPRFTFSQRVASPRSTRMSARIFKMLFRHSR